MANKELSEVEEAALSVALNHLSADALDWGSVMEMAGDELPDASDEDLEHFYDDVVGFVYRASQLLRADIAGEESADQEEEN